MVTFLKSLLSRKFLLALGVAIICFVNKDWNGLLVDVLTYCGINVADAKLNPAK
jgi:hypothetical protein